LLLLLLFAANALCAAEREPARPNPLVWDAMEKSADATPDAETANFQFTVTNTSEQPVEIAGIQPSCGCTVAEMPSRPWILAPGAKGSFTATVDHRGKRGKFTKMLFVYSPVGSQTLRVTVNIPDTDSSMRERNRQMASVDRQAVFRGECASCHVTPTVGKTGAELFQVACAICHAAEHRASMVPDLLVAREPRDAAYWQRWISDGKEGTLMPAFAKRHQGPLSDQQIASLIEYVLARLPTEPRTN
jgi:cytochrome c553